MEPQIVAARNLAAAMRYTRRRSRLPPRLPMFRLAIAALLLALAGAAHAAETQEGAIVMRKWATMDQCAKKAQAAFPDFTPDANAKREAQLRACLESQNLPPRAPQP
jgi:hypothetical protein